MPTRPTKLRQLRFQSLDEVVQDVDHLASSGYSRGGNWSLGQASGHLAQWASFPMDGFPKPPLPIRMIFSLLKVTGMTKRMAENIFKEGFKPGTPTFKPTVPPSSIGDQEGIDQLKSVYERMKSFEAKLHPSPLFGEMSRADFEKATLLHADHHLAFLKPND